MTRYLVMRYFFFCAFSISLWGQKGIPRVPYHPRITPEFLQSLKPTDADVYMGYTEARAKVINRSDWLWGEMADDNATLLNNEALSFVLQNDMLRARQLLEELREKNPQFFPGRYNLGKVYLFFKDHQKALVEFDRAQKLVPQYWRNYYYIGKSHELQGDTNSAAYMYLVSYRHNIYDLDSLVALGDLLTDAKRLREAEDVFKHCLRQDDGFNDALIGLGKINYYYRKYYNATLWFKSVDKLKPYKKEFHFYYAESAFFSRDYETALPEYENMLQFPQDAIYNKISLNRMRHRVRQTKRLLQQTSDIE